MIGRMKAKLLSPAGESIAETLIALLISALALLMLAGAVTTATRVVDLSRRHMAKYYSEDAKLAEIKGSGTATVTLTDNTDDAPLEDQMYAGLASAANTTFGKNVVVRYTADGDGD